MRIGFFSNSYRPYISGVTVSMSTLTEELRALGHRVYLFVPHYPGYKDDQEDIIRIPSFPTPYPGFRGAFPFIKDLPDLDIIHSHDPFGIGWLSQKIAVKHGIPFIYHFHTLFTRYTHHIPILPPAFSKLIISNYLKKFCSRSQSIVVPSKMVKRSLVKWKITQPIEVIPTGLDFSKIKISRRIRQELNIPAGAKVILYVGRISQEKNISFLLEAFRKIKDAYFVMVGGGPQLEEIKALKIPRLVVVGEESPSEVYNYYAAADVFVFSSITETQGLVLVEAKSQGLPIVALFAGGLCDVVRSGTDGFLTPRTQEAFLAKVELLLKDHDLRKKMSSAARLDAHQRFSSQLIAKQVENIYNSLIRK